MNSRPHHYQFAHIWLPPLVLRPQSQFLKLFAPDPAKYLQFMWERLGDELSADERLPSAGLGGFLTRVEDLLICIIVLPEPLAMCEAYFVAVVYSTHASLLGTDGGPASCQYYTLERSRGLAGNPRTVLGSYEPNIRANLGDGPEPAVDAFLAVVVEHGYSWMKDQLQRDGR